MQDDDQSGPDAEPTPGQDRRIPRVQTKLDPRCAICEQKKPLTDDHVFPKVAVDGLRVRISPLYPGRMDGPDSTLSQSGVRFKTLCGSCNSLLGNKYDPHLGNLVRELRTWEKSTVSVLDRIKVELDFEAVTLSVFGHILAASSLHPEMTSDTHMRSSLQQGRVTPEAPKLFYWLARYSYPTIVRGIVKGRFGRIQDRKIPLLSIFKCPPIGFLAADIDDYEGLPRLDIAASEGAARFWPGLVKPRDWPEAPDDDGVIAFGAPARDGRVARPLG